MLVKKPALAAGCKRPTGAPRPRTFHRSRQVSWLAGRSSCRSSRRVQHQWPV